MLSRIKKGTAKLFLISSFWAILSVISCRSDEPIFLDEPVFIQSDIDLFWEVFDQDQFSSNYLQNEYINKGTAGLKDYAIQKDLAKALRNTLTSTPYYEYYQTVRDNTTNLDEVISKSKEGFEKFEAFYPGTRYTNVYFIVGAMTAGGRISENGLIIAVEMFSSESGIDLTDLSEWHQNVIRDKSFIPSIVVHEFVHVQQYLLSKNRSVLESSLAEGMADYISHYLLPEEPFLNHHLHEYGNPKEEELWLQFKNDLSKDRAETEWLYTGSRTQSGHPADMGYYMGYKILEAYASNFVSQEEAIESMLRTNYQTIFEESGYSQKFE